MVRTSLLYLLAGIGLGAFLLIGEGLRRPAPLPGLGLIHAHLLFVGWLLQFGLGVAYWLLPRRRRPENPLSYSERVAFAGYGLLNAGLLLRAFFEPFAGAEVPAIGSMLVVSGVFQAAAGLVFVSQLWRRVAGRPAST